VQREIPERGNPGVVGIASERCQNASSVTVVVDMVDANGSFVAHATVTDADSGDNGRFDCRLDGPSASKFALRRLYATEFVIHTSAVDDRSVAEADLGDPDAGGGPESPGRRVIGEFRLVCGDYRSQEILLLTYLLTYLLCFRLSCCSRSPRHYQFHVVTFCSGSVIPAQGQHSSLEVSHHFPAKVTTTCLMSWGSRSAIAVEGQQHEGLVCGDYGEPRLTSVVGVRVEAFEVNTHNPVFASDLYHASIVENNDIGVSLTQVILYSN